MVPGLQGAERLCPPTAKDAQRPESGGAEYAVSWFRGGQGAERLCPPSTKDAQRPESGGAEYAATKNKGEAIFNFSCSRPAVFFTLICFGKPAP